MNRKGFTLAELLGVVVILAVIMIIAAPNLTKQIKKSEETNKDVLSQKIENAAKIYVAKYYSNEVISNSSTIEFSLNDLEQDGLINLTKNSECDKNNKITVNVSSNKVNFDYNKISCHD